MIFPLTTHVIDADGQRIDKNEEVDVPEQLCKKGESGGVTDTYQGILDRTVLTFAHQAFRTILTCYKVMSMDDYE